MLRAVRRSTRLGAPVQCPPCQRRFRSRSAVVRGHPVCPQPRSRGRLGRGEARRGLGRTCAYRSVASAAAPPATRQIGLGPPWEQWRGRENLPGSACVRACQKPEETRSTRPRRQGQGVTRRGVRAGRPIRPRRRIARRLGDGRDVSGPRSTRSARMADHRSLIARTGHGIGRFRGGRVAPSLGQPGRSLAPVFTWVVKLEHRLIRGSLCCVHNYGQTGRRLVVGLDSPPRSAGSGWCGAVRRR